MGFCCVPGCSSASKKKQNVCEFEELKFYNIPRKPAERFRAFMRAIRREDRWKPGPRTTICNRHFVDGRKSEDPASISWTPSINLPQLPTQTTVVARKPPRERNPSVWECISPPRKRAKIDKENANSPSESLVNESEKDEVRGNTLVDIINTPMKVTAVVHDSDHHYQLASLESMEVPVSAETINKTSTIDHGGYCTPTSFKTVPTKHPGPTLHQEHTYSIEALPTSDDKYEKLKDIIEEQNKKLSAINQRNLCAEAELAELRSKRLTLDKIKNDSSAVQFYTGFPNYQVLMAFYHSIEPKVWKLQYWRGSAAPRLSEEKKYQTSDSFKPGPKRSLSPLDELFMVLVRLRVGLYVQDLSDRFGIDESQVSRTFTTWVNFLYHELQELFPFPDQETIQHNMPKEFGRYPTTRVVIDCTEVFGETPSSLNLQSATWSNYKHHNAWKALVGVTPNGCVSFVSDLFGGRISDKEITKESGILRLLDDGDNLMADRGFDIHSLMPKGTKLNIPAFKGTQAQLPSKDTEETMQIASVRIHVERAIGRIKNYHILDSVMPISLSKVTKQIFTVCAYLTNFMRPLLPPKWACCKNEL